MLKFILAVFTFLSAAYSCLAMPAGWNIRESQHFIVLYKSEDKDFVDELLKRSEGYYRSIPRNLGLKLVREWKGSRRSKVYIYDSARQYQAQTNEPEWSDGSSIQRLRVIFSFSKAKRFMDSVLPHELAHIIFRESVGFNNDSVPVWLEEGIASYTENQDLARVEKSLKVGLSKGLLPSLERLGGMNPRLLKDKNQIDFFYGQALSVVNYLISENGTKRFGFFCRLLGEKQDLESSLFRAFGYKNILELDRSWQEDLKRKQEVIKFPGPRSK